MVNTRHEKALKASSFKGAESSTNDADDERNENGSSSDSGDLNFGGFTKEVMKILELKIRKQVGKAIKNVMPLYISQTTDNFKEVIRKELEEFRKGGMMNDFRNDMANYHDSRHGAFRTSCCKEKNKVNITSNFLRDSAKM
nr:zinc finger, CCHC-type, retrotransposon Gag domain protein [Tanacetum cinerariifolium]GEY80720.1 zinc finger, CCHC-type, retrotransposon Gag domain protein [Tanacetum cinerariifolium]